jgi:hypothetical protein
MLGGLPLSHTAISEPKQDAPSSEAIAAGRKSKQRRNQGPRKPMSAAIAVSIPEHLFVSPAYRALSPLERCLLIELLAVARRVGTDEPLNISVRWAADMCGVGKSHAAAGLATLEERGFLVRVRRGGRRQGRGFASAWRVTCLPFQGEWATCDYDRIHDREHNRKVANDRAHEKFFTPELEALWLRTEASFAAKRPGNDDAEIDDLLAAMDAETSPASLKEERLKCPAGRTLCHLEVSGGADT